MTKKSDAPAIRFKGFSDAWEQRKFSELVQIERGGSPRPIDDFITDAPNGLNWVKIGDAPTQGNYITKTAEKIRPEGLSKTREVHPGDLILSNSMSFGKPYIMGIDGCIHDGWLLIRNTYGVFDLTFLCHLLGTPQMLSQYRSLAAGSTVNNLNKELVGNTYVTIPSITEQRVLGAYLEQLDNLITLHQRKCALLFSPFQSFISMMFTTSTFSWEQRKLGDIADIVGGGTPSTGNQSYWDGYIDWYAPAEIADQIYANSSQKKITGLGYENSSAKMLPPGTVLFTSRAGIGKTAILTRKGCTNQGFQSIVPHRGELDSYFIFSRTEELKRYGELVGAGSTFVEVSGKQMAVMELMMPPTMREQQTIGGFFQQLDHLITLHQRKCIFFTGRAGRLISTVNKKRITSSWEQRKAIDIADYSKGNGYSKGDLTDDGTPIILYGRLYTKYQFAISEVDTFAVPRNGAVYSQGNEVIVPASGETAEDIARASAVEKSGVLLGGDLNILRPFDFINPLFLALAISNGEPQKELAKKAQGKSVVHIHNTDIQEVTIAYPSRTEQDRIVSVFRQLDNLITLHQRKFEKLTNVKKSMLEKMFPQNGSSYPEIRFKGFTDPWEQRKLGELVDVCSGRDYKHLSEGTIPVYGTGGYMLSVNDALSYDRDAIGIGRKGTIDRPYILKAPFWTVDTLFYAIPREKVDLNYAFDIFQNIDWKKKDESTGVPSLSKTAINDIDVLAPKHDEQQIIGQFFAAIDNLITLHQRKPFLMKWRTSDANRNQTNRLVL